MIQVNFNSFFKFFVIPFLYDSFIQFVVKIDEYFNKFIKCFVNFFIAHKFVFDLFLQFSSIHRLKRRFISINNIDVFLKSRNIIKCEFILLKILNDFFNRLFFVEYFKDASNRNFKIVKSNENFIVDVFLIVEIWSYLRLKSMLCFSSKINKDKKCFLIL